MTHNIWSSEAVMADPASVASLGKRVRRNICRLLVFYHGNMILSQIKGGFT